MPHPEEARSAVSKGGNEHLVCCPSFETRPVGAPQDEDFGLVAFTTERAALCRHHRRGRGKDMRQLLMSFVRRSLALWLGMFLCGAAGAQSPTSVAELHERWIELLRATDGDIASKTFEKVIGL